MQLAMSTYRRLLLTKLFVMKQCKKMKKEQRRQGHPDGDVVYQFEPFDLQVIQEIESDELMSSVDEEEDKSSSLESIDE